MRWEITWKGNTGTIRPVEDTPWALILLFAVVTIMCFILGSTVWTEEISDFFGFFMKEALTYLIYGAVCVINVILLYKKVAVSEILLWESFLSICGTALGGWTFFLQKGLFHEHWVYVSDSVWNGMVAFAGLIELVLTFVFAAIIAIFIGTFLIVSICIFIEEREEEKAEKKTKVPTGWKCPVCGQKNQEYERFCSCGTIRH